MSSKIILKDYEVAEMLGLSVKTVRQWRYWYDRGKPFQGPRYFREGRRVRYHIDDVKEYMRKVEREIKQKAL